MNHESYRLMLKRKASATTSAVNTVGECTKAAKQQAQEVEARDTPRYALRRCLGSPQGSTRQEVSI